MATTFAQRVWAGHYLHEPAASRPWQVYVLWLPGAVAYGSTLSREDINTLRVYFQTDCPSRAQAWRWISERVHVYGRPLHYSYLVVDARPGAVAPPPLLPTIPSVG